MYQTLFLIGNGFDKAHGLSTGYNDFRDYVEERDYQSVYDFVTYECMAKDEDWNQLEQDLGNFMPEGVISSYEDEITYGYDENYSAMPNMIHALSDEITWIADCFRPVFYEWINQVDISTQVNNNFKFLITSTNSCFLTFNYTKVLEKVYQVSPTRICHIHGNIDDENSIILGHGDDWSCKHLEETPLSEYEYLKNHGSMNEIYEITELEDSIRNSLRKDVVKCYSYHQNFFEKLSHIKKVFSFGFSYNDIDLFYIKRIIEQAQDNVQWYLDDYDEQKNKYFERQIRKCGFRGCFGRFSIK